MTRLSDEINELKQHVRDMEIELLGDLVEIPTKLETFTSTVSSLSSQVAELKNIQWKLPAEFLNLPSQGEKNTKDDGRNLKDELIDLLGKDVVTQYYTKKLLFDKYCDEMLKKRKTLRSQTAEWRKVLQACPDKGEKGWKTIYDLVKTRVDQLTQTEQELKIDLNQPLKEQDPLNELIDLANKKRKRTSDLRNHSSVCSGTETEEGLLVGASVQLG
ncbi:hypothetical protein Tco_1171986 [Tanacetum coccineum]